MPGVLGLCCSPRWRELCVGWGVWLHALGPSPVLLAFLACWAGDASPSAPRRAVERLRAWWPPPGEGFPGPPAGQLLCLCTFHRLLTVRGPWTRDPRRRAPGPAPEACQSSSPWL